jgi:hypothetical protein
MNLFAAVYLNEDVSVLVKRLLQASASSLRHDEAPTKSHDVWQYF